MLLLISGFLLTAEAGQVVAATPVVPHGILHYIPITLTNSQGIPTPSPFQQMVGIGDWQYSAYMASNLQNIEFFDSNGNIIPSYLESGNTTTLTVIYWLKLADGIPANTSVTVYVGFASTSTNLLNNETTGEAPTLSPSYGRYDDGADVFAYYQSFGGLSGLPPGWHSISSIGGSNTCLVNFHPAYTTVGITSSGGIGKGYCNLYSTQSLTTVPQVVDFFGSTYNLGGGNVSWGLYRNPTDTSAPEMSYAMIDPGVAPAPKGWLETLVMANGNSQVDTHFYDRPPNNVYSISVGSSSIGLFLNYGAFYTGGSTLQVIGGLGFYNSWGYSAGSPIAIYWVHARSYPPNGVMPEQTLGTPISVGGGTPEFLYPSLATVVLVVAVVFAYAHVRGARGARSRSASTTRLRGYLALVRTSVSNPTPLDEWHLSILSARNRAASRIPRLPHCRRCISQSSAQPSSNCRIHRALSPDVFRRLSS